MNDVSIIELRENERGNWWREISNEEKKSIEKGIIDANAGNIKPHSEARKLYAKWL